MTIYTDNKLRERLKTKVKKGTKGGKSGQWSAIKSLILSKLYQSEMKKKGRSPFRRNARKSSSPQKNLREWVKEDWQTSDGKKRAATKSGLKKRYLPKIKWKRMTNKQKRATNAKKLRGSKKGKQYVRVR